MGSATTGGNATTGATDTAPEGPEVMTTGPRLDVGGGSTSVSGTSADGSTTATGTTGFDSAPELPPG
jgi:hypothetical protein